MSILLDLIIVGIILLSTFLGYKKGLIGVAFKIVSFVIAIVITLILYVPVSNLVINNTGLDESIENAIVEKLAISNIEEEGELKKENTNMPTVIVDYINNAIKDTVVTTQNSIVQSVARDLAINIVKIGVMIVLFLVVKIALLFAKAIIEGIAKLPILKQFNEIGGIAYGILRGVIVIYVMLVVVSLLIPVLHNDGILQTINETMLCKILYNNNIILKLFL